MNPSDPRISEWLDGRLSKQEAAEIELLVRSDRHLLRDVEEIRAARILLSTVAKLKVAPDFSQSVMAAIARGVGDEISDPTGSPDLAGLSREDRGIEEEWRSIERQRVAAEIDEAKEDVGSSVLSAQHSDVFNVRSRWLIVPLSTALAGGLLVAFAINAVLMQSRVDPQIAQQNEKQPSQIVSNETLSGRIPSAELSDRLAVALADDEQHVRIVVRDTTARLQLESLIAATRVARCCEGSPLLTSSPHCSTTMPRLSDAARSSSSSSINPPGIVIATERVPSRADTIAAAMANPSDARAGTTTRHMGMGTTPRASQIPTGPASA